MKLEAARKRAGKTQMQIAQTAGVAVRTYQYYETNEKEPGVRTAIRIADALNVSDLRELFAAAPEDANGNQLRGGSSG